MQLPPFSEFTKSLDFEKLDYDLNSFASSNLKKPSDLFSEEQYSFLTQTMSAMLLSMLQQYHQWLTQKIAE